MPLNVTRHRTRANRFREYRYKYRWMLVFFFPPDVPLGWSSFDNSDQRHQDVLNKAVVYEGTVDLWSRFPFPLQITTSQRFLFYEASYFTLFTPFSVHFLHSVSPLLCIITHSLSTSTDRSSWATLRPSSWPLKSRTWCGSSDTTSPRRRRSASHPLNI